MIEPLPNCRSICVSAVSTARHFSLGFTLDMSSPFSMGEKFRAFCAIIDFDEGTLRASSFELRGSQTR
jgi:hypothetical protein